MNSILPVKFIHDPKSLCICSTAQVIDLLWYICYGIYAIVYML